MAAFMAWAAKTGRPSPTLVLPLGEARTVSASAVVTAGAAERTRRRLLRASRPMTSTRLSLSSAIIPFVARGGSLQVSQAVAP